MTEKVKNSTFLKRGDSLKCKKQAWLVLVVSSVLMVVVTFFFMTVVGHTNEVEIELEASPYFSKEEMTDAASTVLKTFKKDWKGANLTQLCFDETFYEEEVTHRYNTGSDDKEFVQNNVIIFESTFKTGPFDQTSLGKGNTVKNWQFVLSRENASSPWRVVDQGI